MAEMPVSKANRIGFEISNAALTGVVLDSQSAIVKSVHAAIADSDSYLQQLIEMVEGLKSEFPDAERLGIAVSGLVDSKTGRVAFSANNPQHATVDLCSVVKAATGLDVVVENDANAAALAEFQLGAGRGSRDMFYVTLGTGVGGAFIFGGEIWRGVGGFAGEFGYVPINSEGTRIEDVASAGNILRRTRERILQDNTSSLSHLDQDEITLEAILSAAESDDDFARMMIERTGMYVGTGVASVINLLNIERIVIGGEITSIQSLVLNAIRERARELSFAPAYESTAIVEGELGREASAIGSAMICG